MKVNMLQKKIMFIVLDLLSDLLTQYIFYTILLLHSHVDGKLFFRCGVQALLAQNKSSSNMMAAAPLWTTKVLL